MIKIKQTIKNSIHFLNELRYDKIPNISSFTCDRSRFIKNDIHFREVEEISLNNLPEMYKWVGAVNYCNNMYCIPNEIHQVLKVNLSNDQISYIPFDYNEDGRNWSGGGIYQNKIYGFPRKANDLLCIEPEKHDSISFIPLHLNYKDEHHYGGVITEDGFLIQPPRRNNTILVINLNDFSVKEIRIAPKHIAYDYANGVLHSSGLIYFFPLSCERIMVYNYKTEEVYFTGKRQSLQIYGGVESSAGDIYGFSGYKNEFFCIQPNTHQICSISLQDFSGSYGCKLGINGKIYNIPGVGDKFYEFDPEKNEMNMIYQIDNLSKVAMCAGGIVSQEGNIYMVPSFGNIIYKVIFDNKVSLSETEMNFFQDYY